MDELLVRAAMAVPVAVLLPLGLPKLPRARSRMALAAGIVIAALLGSWSEPEAWVVTACAVAAAGLPVRRPARPWSLLCGSVTAVAISAVVIDVHGAGDAIETVVDDWRVAVVVLGGLFCIFVGGAAISAILHPFAERVGDRSQVSGMEHAGRIIGWIERALLYGLVLIGAPGAAALVIAGKSIARFPSFDEERFAEYFLIGTLLSLAFAIGAAIGVRAIIGVDPVAPL